MPARALSVLVVDDSHGTAEALRTCGYNARAVDRPLAFRLPPADFPDVVVAEPDAAGGCELARQLSPGAGGRRPLLVAASAGGSDADRTRTAEAGYDLHLVRPVEPAVLAGVMRRFARVFAACPPGTPN